jgi:excisionase family DNA binding protein
MLKMADDDPLRKEDRLLTIKEVAELTGLQVSSLYHLVSDGRIPVVRLSRRCLRFRLSALHQWWDELATGNGTERKR